jgi:hypothetical protein
MQQKHKKLHKYIRKSMNSHQLGNYYERLSQEDLLKQFADRKPRIIDTKTAKPALRKYTHCGLC